MENKTLPANESPATNANIEIAEPFNEMTIEENPVFEEPVTAQENVTQESAPSVDTKPKTIEKAKTIDKKKKNAKGVNSWDKGTFVIDDGEDKVTFKGGRIETDEVIIENGKVKLKHPPIVPKYGDREPLTPEELKRLTPKQRKQIRNAVKMQKQKEMQMQKEVQKSIKDAERDTNQYRCRRQNQK